MSTPGRDLQLRTATIGDAAMVADLDTARTPSEPHDGALMAFLWTHQPSTERCLRLIAEHDGVASAYVGAEHSAWVSGSHRFGRIRIVLHPSVWSEQLYLETMARAESWLRAEGTETSIVRVRENMDAELKALAAMGYRETRRHRVWHLDLVRGRERLLASAQKSRAAMVEQGIGLMTLDEDRRPDRLHQLYEVDMAATKDVPKTMPWPVPPYEEWRRSWFENPGIREDRFWLALKGDETVGFSAIAYPPERGIPWTSFTATARGVRGRGVARALKYQTIAQAIELGVEVIETSNDSENVPILHLNKDIGYEPARAVIELHRRLAA